MDPNFKQNFDKITNFLILTPLLSGMAVFGVSRAPSRGRSGSKAPSWADPDGQDGHGQDQQSGRNNKIWSVGSVLLSEPCKSSGRNRDTDQAGVQSLFKRQFILLDLIYWLVAPSPNNIVVEWILTIKRSACLNGSYEVDPNNIVDTSELDAHPKFTCIFFLSYFNILV